MQTCGLLLAAVTCCCWCSRLGLAAPPPASPSPTTTPSSSWKIKERQRTAMGMGVPMSPCPAVFRYERRGGGWAGVVTVPAPPTDMPLVLRVDLSIAAALTTKYAGTLQLQEGRRALLARLAAGDRRPVRYTLRFPAGMPLPAVTRVHVMAKDLCRPGSMPGTGTGGGAGSGGGSGASSGSSRGSPETGVTTTISLEHSLRPEPVRDVHAPAVRWGWGQQPTPTPTTTPRQPGTVQLFLQNDGDTSSSAPPPPVASDTAAANEDGDEDDQVCGRPVHHRLLVAGGAPSNPGDWPWLAAVFAATSLGLEYHCAGSLVSAGHVLTAAHCVQRLGPESLLVYVGRHNVRKWTEPQAQAREVAVVHVHPDHQAANYTADVAVLQLSERVAYDWFVRPVCVDWAGPEDLGLVVGRVGTVVGWGRDEHGHAISDEPRAARLPVVSQETCLRSRPEFVHVTSERTFCAGFRNGTGPCNGDSGSGLVLPSPAPGPGPGSGWATGAGADGDAVGHGVGEGEPWFLRGVVSLSLMDGERRTCDLRHYVVFTDVAKFRGWLGALIRPRPASATPVRRPGLQPHRPASIQVATKQVETQTDGDLDDQPIWDSDPDPLPK